MALSSSSSLHRPICPNGIFGSSSSSNYCHFVKWSPKSCASSFKLRGLSTATATTAIQAVQNQDSPGPWLMLPPEYEDGEISYKECKTGLRQLGKMTYKFYSLFDNKLQTPCFDDEVIRDLPLVCRGSSHGWLALLGPRNEGFFLYNPITRRHIMLPSIFNLPKLSGDDILRTTSSTDWRDVQKLILTCSPDEDEENCRAVMINGFGNMLAFCCPGKSKEWTTMMRDEEERGNRFYDDCVYSASRKLLYGLTKSTELGVCDGLEIWDLVDPSSPKLIKVDKPDYCPAFELSLWWFCSPWEYLVVAGEDLLLVVQYTTDVGQDGSCTKINQRPLPDNLSPKTVRFDVFKHNPKKGRFKFVDSLSSLGGLAIFVGQHHDSVAIPASRFPELKSDSIYFTDGDWEGPLDCHNLYKYDDERVGDRDIGIYNYKDKTVSQCYYPCDKTDVKKTTPIWFFPSRTI
ncbi:hypothetical protein CASFOL_026631 [Castilleja foliolosa]|uniref:KIB1-4 beta-propeller domain-containing protein n=1 Tax=Castilleja foliolosa TaxID=1961234 RepID=A0ABD3CJF3_9LAMI